MLWGRAARAAILWVQVTKTGPAAKADKSTHCDDAGGKDMGSRRQDYGFCRSDDDDDGGRCVTEPIKLPLSKRRCGFGVECAERAWLVPRHVDSPTLPDLERAVFHCGRLTNGPG
jgi:hypothetical protein